MTIASRSAERGRFRALRRAAPAVSVRSRAMEPRELRARGRGAATGTGAASCSLIGPPPAARNGVLLEVTAAVDYKDTVHLPKTDFPMKANLPQREPDILRGWQEKDVFAKLVEKNGARPGARRFVLHDGPPYANGDIHIGHALNKILKDLIVKYRSMKGDVADYIPGWDCHGLPI